MLEESRNYKNHSTLGTIADKNKDLRVKQLLQKNRSNQNASVVNFNQSTQDSYDNTIQGGNHHLT
jgi:hypothetical protein